MNAPDTTVRTCRMFAVVIDTADPERLAAFWSELLGLSVVHREEGWIDLAPLGAGGPNLSFQALPTPKPAKNRIHFDVRVDDLPAATARVEALGGTAAGDVHPGGGKPWRVMCDPDGNEFCLVT